MMDVEANALLAANARAADRGVNICEAAAQVLAFLEDVDRRLEGLSWWARLKLRVRYAIVIPSLRAIQQAVCGHVW